MLIIWRGLKMDNETFVETFKKIHFNKSSYFGSFKNKTIEMEYMENVFYCFEVQGSFLNIIPQEKRLNLIEDIREWIHNMSENPCKTWYEKTYLHKQPSDSIKADIKTIQKMKGILYDDDNLLQFAASNNEQKLADLWYLLDDIEKDIQQKQFTIIDKIRYYKEEPVTKQELTKIIKTFQISHGLKQTPRKIKNLVDSIPFVTDKEGI